MPISIRLKSTRQKGVLALVTLSFAFGLIAITIRYLGSYFELYQQLYLSAATAFLISLVIFPKTLTVKKLASVPKMDWLIILSRIICGYIIGGFLYREAVFIAKISNVTFIQALPFAAVFGWLFFKEQLTLKKLALLLVAYVGVVLIAVTDYSNVVSFGRGKLFSLVSGAFFSMSYVLRKWQSDVLMDTEITQIILVFASLFLLAASMLRGEGLPTIPTEPLLLVCLFLTGAFNAINIFLINYGFKHVKATVASNILTLEALFAMLLAIIFYSEVPNVKELVGGLFILFGAVAMNYVDKKE